MKKQAFFLAIALALHYMLDNIGFKLREKQNNRERIILK